MRNSQKYLDLFENIILNFKEASQNSHPIFYFLLIN